MQVYHLAPPEGEWVYCGRCRLTGNKFDLALLRESPEKVRDAAREDPAFPAWQTQILLRKFQEEAQDAPFPAALYPVCERLCIAPERLPRAVAGITTSEKLSKIARSLDQSGLGGKHSRPWLCTPTYDVPGHIAGFSLAGAGEGDNEYATKDLLSQEGISFIEGLFDADGGTTRAIITPDAGAAWYLHAHNSLQRLPLCLATSLPKTWGQITTRGVTAWHPFRAAEAFRLAAQDVPSGHVASLAAAVDYRQREPLALVTHLLGKAVPWIAAAGHKLQSLSLQAGRQLLAEMRLSPEARSALRAHVPAAEILGSPALAGVDIREVAGGGWFTADNRLVSSATIRITEIVACKGRKTAVYGVVTLDGKDIGFQAQASAIDRLGLLEWLHRYLRTRGAGLLQFAPVWNTRAFQIACAFSQPRYTYTSREPGWDPSRQVFILPAGEIARGGRVRLSPAIPATPAPGENLRFDGEVSGEIVRRLSAVDPASVTYWAGCLAIFAHVAAPIANRTPPPVLLQSGGHADGGTDTGMLRTIALSLGCRETDRPAWNVVSRFPAVLRRERSTRRRVSPDLLDRFLRTVSPSAAAVLGWQERYWCINPPPGWSSLHWLDASAQTILPSLLCRVLSRSVWDTTDLLAAVTKIAEDWIVAEGGDPAGVRAGATRIDTPEKTPAAVHLIRLLWLFYRRRYIRGLLRGGDSGAFLDVGGLYRNTRRRVPYVPADFTALERSLRTAGYLAETTDARWHMTAAFSELCRRVNARLLDSSQTPHPPPDAAAAS